MSRSIRVYARGCTQETLGWPLSVRDRLNAFWRAREPATQPRLNIGSPTFSCTYIYIEARPSLTRLFLAVYTPIVTFHPESPRERPRVRRKDRGRGGLVHEARFIIPLWPGQKIHSPIPRAQRTGSVLAHFNYPSEGWLAHAVALGRRQSLICWWIGQDSFATIFSPSCEYSKTGPNVETFDTWMWILKCEKIFRFVLS